MIQEVSIGNYIHKILDSYHYITQCIHDHDQNAQLNIPIKAQLNITNTSLPHSFPLSKWAQGGLGVSWLGRDNFFEVPQSPQLVSRVQYQTPETLFQIPVQILLVVPPHPCQNHYVQSEFLESLSFESDWNASSLRSNYSTRSLILAQSLALLSHSTTYLLSHYSSLQIPPVLLKKIDIWHDCRQFLSASVASLALSFPIVAGLSPIEIITADPLSVVVCGVNL